MLNFRPGDSENCPEWVMIELQGDLETKSQAASLSGKFIGDLHYTKKVCLLFVNHERFLLNIENKSTPGEPEKKKTKTRNLSILNKMAKIMARSYQWQ